MEISAPKGNVMENNENQSLKQFYNNLWRIISLTLTVSGLVIILIGISTKNPFFAIAGGTVMTLGFFVAVVGLQIICFNLSAKANQNQKKLTMISNALKEHRDLLKHISSDVKLSEASKRIAFKDADREGLSNFVLETLHKHEFEKTDASIKEIAQTPSYEDFAETLRAEVKSYKEADKKERVDKVITHINMLMEKYQWVKASQQIESLMQAFPDSEAAKNMPEVLSSKKEQRKRELLEKWNEAVNRNDTDQSLSILRELDLYLTPSEALALQESAKDAFRSKLHNLGVQFSMEASDKQWTKAIVTGAEIIKKFPNTKMADEIKGKMDIMKSLAEKNMN